jgi:3-hydroxymyristoyl/3-hydroxydecanoyl-(acyl carrier protein) dehydratase
VPANPWYCWKNNYPTTPYSVLMELGLQPCGFLSAHLGSPLTDPQRDFYFRNLDGSGLLRREVDIRGRKITNRVTLRSSDTLPGMIIQEFDFALDCDGEVFFTGDASFGYFTAEALAKQAGLDGGRPSRPWAAGGDHEGIEIELCGTHEDLYHAPHSRPHARLARGQLGFLDHAFVVAEGGEHGKGYVSASKAVDPDAWFFRCHFLADPVMPGSLGVEAVIEALQIFVLTTGLDKEFTSPRFGPAPEHKTQWKYRGQITQDAPTMKLEAHITAVTRGSDGLLVTADANLWREDLRIYRITNVGLMVREA